MEFKALARHINQTRCHLRGIQNVHKFTTSAVLSKKTAWFKYYPFKDEKAFAANLPIKPFKKELFQAQRKRKPTDYPLADDQRASWKHTRWYDEFYDKWVETKPHFEKNEFDINYKDKRKLIHEQDTLRNKFHLLLDSEPRSKYVIKPLNIEFSRNASYYYQFLTNTKFIHGMPYNIQSMSVDDSVVENFESFLTNSLQMEYIYHDRTSCEKHRKKRADRILAGIVDHLFAAASPSNPDFSGCEVDRNPENSMFWLRGTGFHHWTLPDDHPVLLQSHDSPLYQIRTKTRLPEFTPWMEEFMLTGDLPQMDMTPNVYDLALVRYRNMITPGVRYRAGDVPLNYQEALEEGRILDLPPPATDPCLFGHTQFISLPEEFDRDWYKANLYHCDITDQIEEHIKANGIMSGWTWSAAQAYYQGHWMDQDIEEPISVQTVITDGEYISFFCYQLNTIAIDPPNADSNPRRNICYGTPFMKLYNRVEGTDDFEIYRDPVNLLLKFISNSSQIKTVKENVISHNSTLEVQEWDAERSSIEEQTPKHIRDKETALRHAEEKKKELNMGLKDKVIKMIMD